MFEIARAAKISLILNHLNWNPSYLGHTISTINDIVDKKSLIFQYWNFFWNFQKFYTKCTFHILSTHKHASENIEKSDSIKIAYFSSIINLREISHANLISWSTQFSIKFENFDTRHRFQKFRARNFEKFRRKKNYFELNTVFLPLCEHL